MNAFETTRDRALDASRWIASQVKTKAGKAWSHLETLRTKGAAAAEEAVDAAEDAADEVVSKARGGVAKVKTEASEAAGKVESDVKKAAQSAKKKAEETQAKVKKTAQEAAKTARKTVAKATTGPVNNKMTKSELYDIATALDISGRSGMKKADLLAAIKAEQAK